MCGFSFKLLFLKQVTPLGVLTQPGLRGTLFVQTCLHMCGLIT